MATRTKKKTSATTAKKVKKTPRTRKPDGMTLEQWQTALRREHGREQDFKLTNIGEDPIFSEFLVTNPESQKSYRVAIRGREAGDNFCSCPDFSVNTLGTCKHVEFTLAKLIRKRGGKGAFKRGHEPDYSSVYLHYGARREVRFRPGGACPENLLQHAAKYFDEDGVLKEDACLKFHTFLKKAPRDAYDLRCHGDVLEYVAQMRDAETRSQALAKAFPKGAQSPAFRKLLKVELFPYQRKGALFAARAGRCLIADDMGLGKTIEAIAAAKILAQVCGVERVLVIAPTSLKHQWKSEVEKFSDASAQVVEGQWRQRVQAYREDSFFKIINYDVVHTDVGLIEDWAPDLIILDEAQRIKNWKTRTAKSVKQLQSDYAFVLTGTPLENRIEELHSIVEFIDRHRLGPLFRFLASHQHTEEKGRVIGYKNLSSIMAALSSILIRRTKAEVLDELPERVDKHFFVPMTPEQANIHADYQKTVADLVRKWRRRGFLTEKEQVILMSALQMMRMVCNSTYLVDHETDCGSKADECATLLEEILEEPGVKVVIFSQWLRTHELIIRRLEQRGLQSIFYHGSVPSKKRKDLIAQFKEDPECRIFLSTDAGGVGLNLQNASVVINMDQPWNPAVLEQRIARVHRLGQHRNVRVVHFVAENTIESQMLDVLKFKKSVFAGVLDGGEDEVFLGKSRMKKFMETVDKITADLPEPAPSQPGPPGIESIEEAVSATASEPSPSQDTQAPPSQTDELIALGMDFIGKLGQMLQAPPNQGEAPHGDTKTSSFIEQDPATGASYLKLPVPEPEMIEKVAGLLGGLANALRGKG